MNPYRTRRATTDDLEQLIALWQSVQLPAQELEKSFTDFQVAEDAAGKVAGAVGLQIAGTDAKIYGETFADFGLSDTLRPLLWERLHSVARNHGLFRLWINDTAPYWRKDAGFVEASPAVIQKLPEPFGPPNHGWLVLQIREESASSASLDREFALFKQAEQTQREKILKQARALNITATVISSVLFLFFLFWLIQEARHWFRR